jgi:prolyl-tRNA editing enzyme YbaK/EbsC (Cys-tRNA(Pro) deacylase)
MSIFTDTITKLFDEKGLPYKKISHGPCRTSEESAAARAEGGGGLVVGAKALLLKFRHPGAGAFGVYVLAGSSKLDPKAIDSKFRMATAEEMAEQTGGVQPGAMPPFATPIFPALQNLFFDTSFVDADGLVGFNAGDHCISLVVHVKDLVVAAAPNRIFPFSLVPPPSICDEIVEGRNYTRHQG